MIRGKRGKENYLKDWRDYGYKEKKEEKKE